MTMSSIIALVMRRYHSTIYVSILEIWNKCAIFHCMCFLLHVCYYAIFINYIKLHAHALLQAIASFLLDYAQTLEILY